MTNGFNPNQTRAKRGEPTPAGRWVAEPNDEADGPALELAQPERQFSPTNLRPGSSTPRWGKVQWVEDVAPGITYFDTAGHGGYKLSADRNKLVPPVLRIAGGWYEHDQDQIIVAHTFPNEMRGDTDLSDFLVEVDHALRDFYPDQWEKLTGRQLQPGESVERDKKNWAEAHRDDFVMIWCKDDETDDQVAHVGAKKESTGEVAEFSVPSDQVTYEARRANPEIGHAGRFVIDESTHVRRATEPKPPAPVRPRYRTVTVPTTVSPTAAKHIREDLGKQYRFADGRVASLAQLIREDGVTEKVVGVKGGKRYYSLVIHTSDDSHDNYSFPVRKSTWDALDAPDTRGPKQLLHERRQIIQYELDQLSPQGWGGSFAAARREEQQKLRAELAQVNAELDALTEN